MQNIGLFCVTTPGVNQSEKLGSVNYRDQCLSGNNHSVHVFQSLFNTNIFEKCIFDVLSKMSTLLKMLYVSLCVAAVCGSTC